MAFGFSGLQYLYVGRWFLFLLQFVTFALFTAIVLLLDPNGAIVTYAARFCLAGSDATSVKLQIELLFGLLLVLNLLIGMFAIKRDKQGGLLSDDYKHGWFWTFFVLFGFTGAHLAYMKSRFLLGVHLIFVSCPTMFILLCSRDISSFDEFTQLVVAGIGAGFIAAFLEVVLLAIVGAVLGTTDENK